MIFLHKEIDVHPAYFTYFFFAVSAVFWNIFLVVGEHRGRKNYGMFHEGTQQATRRFSFTRRTPASEGRQSFGGLLRESRSVFITHQ